jgi:hypothetical protein
MQKSTLITIIFLLLISQVTHVFANSENVSREIERVEIGENSKTIYYKDGTKEMFVTGSLNVNFGSSVGTAHVIGVPTPAPSIPFDKIFQILKQILEGIFGTIGLGCLLLAWKILNIIKGLRRGRPKDYNEVSWKDS